VKTGLLLAFFMLTSTFGWSQSQRVIIMAFWAASFTPMNHTIQVPAHSHRSPLST
jgi:hypothetical protein